MTAIREFFKVKNHELHIKLPEDFDYEEVEVIVMPKNHYSDNLEHLADAVEAGLASQTSPKTHQQIFDALKEKYAN